MDGKIDEEERLRRYRARLALPAKKPSAQYKAALDRAHELRRFEIENYWRRSTYFWGFQLAALAALAVARQSGTIDPIVLMIVAILGMATAYTGYLTAQGSKFWQRNWEGHVDLLENEVEGLLHKTVLVRKRRFARSVSQASERLWAVLTVGWIGAFGLGALLFADLRCGAAFSPAKAAVIAALTLFAGAAMGWMWATPRSALHDRSYDFDTLEKL